MFHIQINAFKCICQHLIITLTLLFQLTFFFMSCAIIRFNFYIQILPVIYHLRVLITDVFINHSSYFKHIACSQVDERCWKPCVFITLIFLAFWEFFHCQSGFIYVSFSNTWNHARVVFGISLLLISSQNSHLMHFSGPCKRQFLW